MKPMKNSITDAGIRSLTEDEISVHCAAGKAHRRFGSFPVGAGSGGTGTG